MDPKFLYQGHGIKQWYIDEAGKEKGYRNTSTHPYIEALSLRLDENTLEPGSLVGNWDR